MDIKLYREQLKCGEKKFQKKMLIECKEFAQVAGLKCNRQRDMAEVLVENLDKFPFLHAISIGMLSNNEGARLHSIITVLIADNLQKVIHGNDYGINAQTPVEKEEQGDKNE